MKSRALGAVCACLSMLVLIAPADAVLIGLDSTDFDEGYVDTVVANTSTMNSSGERNKPPFTSEPFWDDESLIEEHTITNRFKDNLSFLFFYYQQDKLQDKLKAWPIERYYAIDLLDYLETHEASVGSGEFLTIRNIRNESIFLTREQIRQHRPQIVIGIDDEQNLFRLNVWYRSERKYSWCDNDGIQPKLFRPVGAFLYFETKPPAEVRNGTYARFGLTTNSFSLNNVDFYAPIRNVSEPVWKTLTGEMGCLTCHSLGGAVSRSHHVLVEDGSSVGGYALALEEYDTERLHNFLFDQKSVAGLMGVRPVMIDESTAVETEELVTKFRRRMLNENKLRAQMPTCRELP